MAITSRYYRTLSMHRFEVYFSFRYDSLIDAPHGVPNCAGEVEVMLTINDKHSKRFPTGIGTTNLIWDGRHGIKIGPKTRQLQDQIDALHYQIEDSWYVLMKGGFEYNAELILKGIVQPSGRIKTALAFGYSRPTVRFGFDFLPDPESPERKQADPFRPGEMVLNLLMGNDTRFGPYRTGIRTTRAQAAAYRPAFVPTLEQIKLKAECQDLAHRFFTQLPTIYNQVVLTRVDETALSLNLQPLQAPTEHETSQA